ncbi:MAG: hypothetical protein K2X66_04940 [Cyanobacteria bacterium]|nr:hypothetical protein [Cyanobacteriota bacterium]
MNSLITTPSPVFGAYKKKPVAPSKAPTQKNTNPPVEIPNPQTAIPETPKPLLNKAKPAKSTAPAVEKIPGPPPTPFDGLSIENTEFTVFDIETTGLLARADKPNDPVPEGGYDDLTELSAVKYKNGIEVSRFHTLVKPVKPIPQELELKTNITNELVQREGIPTAQAMDKFFAFIGENPILIGHNAKWFDTKFLRAIITRYNLPYEKERLNYDHVIDTKLVAQKLFPDCVWQYSPEAGKKVAPTPGPNSPPDLKLTSLAGFFGFDTSGAHRAENDVGMAAKVFYKMVSEAKAKGVPMETVGDVYQYQFTAPTKYSKKPPAKTSP